MIEISRRRLLSAVALGLTTAAGCGTGTYRGPQRSLTIASGPPRGFYLEFVELLAAQIRDAEPRLRATAISTDGSLENLQRLHDGQVDLAIVLADTAQATATIGGPPPTPVPMRAIGRIYQNYLHLVVLAASPIHTLADLAGRTVSLNAYGSATKLTGKRLLEVAGLAPSTPSAAVHVYHTPSDAIIALEAGRIDALLSSAGVPTPLLAELSARRDIRLLPLDSALPAMRLVYGPVYQP
ncbi:MAG: TAXI family TRAP transporter solute-binding subunit, partial [Pseudonocardiaceae bacterium]